MKRIKTEYTIMITGKEAFMICISLSNEILQEIEANNITSYGAAPDEVREKMALLYDLLKPVVVARETVEKRLRKEIDDAMDKNYNREHSFPPDLEVRDD